MHAPCAQEHVQLIYTCYILPCQRLCRI